MKTNIIKIILTYLLVLAISIPVYSINSSYTFKRLGIEDGLSQSTIYSIIQDSEGYMWFATANGLNKYDGYNFQVFTNNPYDTNSISDNSITSLFEDKEGTIWIGTIKGILNRYNRSTNSFTRFYTRNIKSPLTSRENEYYEYPIIFSRNDNNSITSIAEDKNNNLWLGTWGKGILIFNKKTQTISQYYHKPESPNSLSYNRIMKILIDREGNIWIGTFGGGLNKIIYNDNLNSKDKNAQLSFIHFKNNRSNKYSLSDNKITTLFEDNEGNIWIGTYSSGLNEIQVKEKNLSPKEIRFKIYRNNKKQKENIGSNSIMAILEDKQNCLWLGTFGNGLTKFNVHEHTFSHFEHNQLNSNSLSGNDVISLCEDSSGIIWAGTHLGEGITKLEMSKVKFGQIKNDPANKNSLSDDVVWAIYQDIHRNLWIGTYRGGLNKYNIKNNNFTHYFHNPDNPFSISDNHIRAIAEDKFGNFWIGTYSGGLDKFNPATGKFISYKHNPNDPSSIGANQVQDIFIDSASNVWLATFTGGLNKFNAANINNNKIKFDHFVNNPSDPHSLSDNRVYTLFEDREGVLWIGTFGGGLDKYV
ncbi:MAG: two-component regulator propeller domain-containing protein, partial [Ignavibacteriaceae bacterium]